MKQITTILLSFLAYICLYAQGPTSNEAKQINDKAIKFNKELVSKFKSRTECKEAFMKSHTQAKAPITDPNGAVTEPKGELHHYSFSTIGEDGWGESYIAGIHAYIYYDESENDLYIQDLFDYYLGDSYYTYGKLTGDLTNGEIEFSTDAPVCYSYGTLLYPRIVELDEDLNDYVLVENQDSFKFTITDGVIHAEDLILVLYDPVNEEAWYVQRGFYYEPIDIDQMTVTEIPKDAESDYYYQSSNGEEVGIVKIYRSGKDFYFYNIFGYNYTFKGTLNDNNQIEVELPQLVGTGDMFIYINTYVESDNEVGYDVGINDKIYFDYNEYTGDISNDGDCLAIFAGNKYLEGWETYTSLEFIKFTEDEEPVTVPATAQQKLYLMDSEYDYQGNHRSGLMKIARDGNDVYFMRVDNSSYDVVMRGTLDPSSNIVSVDLAQIVGVSGTKFLGIAAGKQNIVEVEDYYLGTYKEIRYVIDENKDNITFSYDPEKQSYKCNDILAIIDAQKQTVSIALIYPFYTPVEDVPVIPEDATTSSYVFTSDGDTNSADIVTVSRSGNDFYFTHDTEYSSVGNVTFHGTLNEDGYIEVKIPQLVSHGSNEQGVFLRVGYSVREQTPDGVDLETRTWKRWYDEENVSSLMMEFNENLNTISYPDSMAVVISDNTVLMESKNFTYETYSEGAATPANPTDLTIYDKSEDYWGGGQRYKFEFVIPCKDIDNNYLSYENITYRIYFDDEPYVFTPEDYPQTFSKETTDIPFNHPATSEITNPAWNDNMRQIYFYELPKEKIGVQSTYHYGDQSNDSEIVYISVTGVGIEDTANDEGEIVDIKYYDISGRQVETPQNGIFIEKVTYDNDNMETNKVILK